ncbi:hypothetical protein CBR_g21140 [Chara braunii]|uniref:Uncharacterized protein n=1 Tax=Chara braunii TaxID=69332 RepID=A0A388L0W7_CHABU|nr:hypothetical protein CBR_g21140 [Chara braunii]|eukprot:GBG75898.1 hypothetical protein CBR_g21140 [Chara braunii]
MDEIRQHFRMIIQEKRETEERRREEEQRRIQEENEKRREHDFIRRTEEMRLLLEAGMEEKWRKQNKRVEEEAAAAKAKAEEARAKAEAAKQKPEEARVKAEEARMRSTGKSSDLLGDVERVITSTTVLLAMKGQIPWLRKYMARSDILPEMLDLKQAGHCWCLRDRKPMVKEDVRWKHGETARTSILTWLDEEWKKDAKVQRTIVFQGGEIWTDGWKKIKNLFGMTKVRIDGRPKKLATAKGELQRGTVCILLGITRTPTTTSKRLQELRDMVKKPFLFKGLAARSTNQLVGLYRTAGFFGDKKTKNDLRLKIDQAIRKKTRMGVRKRVQVKVVYDRRIVKRRIRETTEEVVTKCVADQAIANLIKSRIQVTWCRNRTVGEIIHNHRRHANVSEKTCVCQGVDLPIHEGHVMTRFSDLPDIPSFVRNAKNVTCHTETKSSGYFVNATVEATRHLKSCEGDVRIPTGGFLNGQDE